MPRKRRIGSIKAELLTKSREAMLCAIQVFNSPKIVFKTENFVVLSIIAWTYLMHAYYRSQNVDYRYSRLVGNQKRYDRTKRGSYKYWELERCLNDEKSPIVGAAVKNLRFLIGLRHEIEHQMTTRLDDFLSARFQACCLNYNYYIKELFGESCGIDRDLSVTLQLSTISKEQANQLNEFANLPKNIASFINEFDDELSDEEFNSQQFAYRVFYVEKTANRKGQADAVVEFIRPDAPEAQGLNRERVLIRDRERKKFRPGRIVELMREKGFTWFNMTRHTEYWKSEDAKRKDLGFGVEVEGTWYWYENWIEKVETYCRETDINK